jgi:hypothetical protein
MAAKAWPKPTGEVQQFKRNTRDLLPPDKYPADKLARMDRAYKVHVAYSLRGGIDRAIPPSVFNQTGAAFYGVPAGSTRAQVEEVLRRSFRLPSPLARLAQQYREQAKEN